MTNIRVVPATPEALAKIKAWLEVEDTVHRETLDAQEAHWDPKVELPTKGFLCNWNLVEKTFETDPGAVQVLLEGDEPVGFIDGLDIMEVRPDLRGRGYGRRLAEFMLDWATRRGYSVAQIEIAPDDAIPFWRRMGFTVANASRSGPSGGVPAYKILDHRFELGEGPRIPYSVAFYSQARDYDPTVKPFVVFQGEGERLEDGSVQLPQRAFSFREADPDPTPAFQSFLRRMASGHVRSPSTLTRRVSL